MTRSRRLVARTAFLLLGAAIFVAFLLLQVGLGQLIITIWRPPLPVVILLVALPLLLVGFLPGLREVEVAAAHTLLGVESELAVPRRPHWTHRWRSAVWVLLHLIIGGLSGLALVAGVPAAISGAWSVGSGRTPVFAIPGVGFPATAGRRWLVVVVLLASAVVFVALTVLAGRWLTWLAPRLLGPTWRDRLDLAESRLRAEAEHRRLARELHDGVGHALSIISLHSAAGRRVLTRDPDTAARSLHTIEQTARRALDDLDQLLGVLRSEDAARAPEPDLTEVETVVAAHREVGLQITSTIVVTESLPSLLSATAYRIAAEGLANAQKHGAGSARLLIEQRDRVLIVEVRSPRSSTRGRDRVRGGRGLTGIGERVAAFGGRCTSGPVGAEWVLRAELPLPGRPAVRSASVDEGTPTR